MNYLNTPGQISYTTNEVAIMLGVKPATVRAWISRKEMRANKVNGRLCISPQQISDFYKQRKTGEFVDHTYANGPVNRLI